MVAAGTVRSERYGPIIRDRGRRELRVGQGLPEQPLAVIVSRGLELDPTLPLLADPDTRGRRPDALRRRPPRVRRQRRLHPDRDASRRAHRAAGEMGSAPGPLAKAGRSECGPRRRVIDRRAVPGDLAAARRRHRGRRALLTGTLRPSRWPSSCGCCSNTRASSTRTTKRDPDRPHA